MTPQKARGLCRERLEQTQAWRCLPGDGQPAAVAEPKPPPVARGAQALPPGFGRSGKDLTVS